MRHRSDRRRPLTVGARTFRFDTPRPTSPPAGTDRGTLLGLFRAWFRETPTERRRMPRHEVAPTRVWVGWYRRGTEFHAQVGRLGDVSRGGARIVLTGPPPKGQTVWLCIGQPDPDDCLEARVLDVRTARRGECTIRLAFRDPCPHPFFEAAVGLIAAGRTRRRPDPGTPGALP